MMAPSSVTTGPNEQTNNNSAWGLVRHAGNHRIVLQKKCEEEREENGEMKTNGDNTKMWRDKPKRDAELGIGM